MSQILKLTHENQQLKRQVSQYKQVLGISPFIDDSILKGGYRVVKTITDRDKIDCCHRKLGMKVLVIGNDLSFKEYILKTDDCKKNIWEEVDVTIEENEVFLIEDYSELSEDLTTQKDLNLILKQLILNLQTQIDNIELTDEKVQITEATNFAQIGQTQKNFNKNVSNYKINSDLKNQEQDDRLTEIESENAAQNDRLFFLEEISYVWSPTNRTLTLYDGRGKLLSQVSLLSLDNEGTDIRYNASTLSLELYNADNELLDSIPVSSFIGSVGTQLQLNSNQLQLKDSQGNVLSSVSFEVSNINGLQTALNSKQDKLQSSTGNIGVGKTDASATEKLDVNGNVKANKFLPNYANYTSSFTKVEAINPTNNDRTLIDIPSGGSVNGENITFSTEIKFDKFAAVSSKNVDSNITFTKNLTGAKIGYYTLVRLVADGTHNINFSNFKKLTGSQDYDNYNGRLNVAFFYYDGTDAWVNIWQEDTNIDSIAPTAPTLTTSNITFNSVTLNWSGATDNIDIYGYNVYMNGSLLTFTTGETFNATSLNSSTTYVFTVKAIDTSGNISVASNSASITTLSSQNVVFDSLSGATYNSITNTLSSSSQNTGGLRTTPITGDFEVWSENTITPASVIAITENTSGGYVWVGSSNISYKICAYFYGGELKVAINSSNNVTVANIATTDTRIKMKRNDNDCLIYTSSNGVDWILRHTQTGILSGVTNVYIQGIFAITQANSMSLKLIQL